MNRATELGLMEEADFVRPSRDSGKGMGNCESSREVVEPSRGPKNGERSSGMSECLMTENRRVVSAISGRSALPGGCGGVVAETCASRAEGFEPSISDEVLAFVTTAVGYSEIWTSAVVGS